MNRKVGRQLSLRCETPTLKSRRSSLRRQLSEDDERAPRIKLAWAEDSKSEDVDGSKAKADASILYPDHRQHLADRLRQVWQDKKTNLNIDLNASGSPKINESLQPEMMMTNQQRHLKQIFQKQIRKNARTPPPNPQERPIVVVPIIERPKTAAVAAVTKREQFQKRTNSAFSTSLKNDKRAPLIRSSSLPTKNEPKTKFPSKKRPKSSKRKDSISETIKPPDVITMVSLVSPSRSDNEEETAKADSNVLKIKVPQTTEHKNSAHRKNAKSVSFQQSSVHAVRSFSASFPLRRGSLATALLLGNAAKKLIDHGDGNSPDGTRNEEDDDRVIADSVQIARTNSDLEDSEIEKEVIAVADEDCPKEKECWDTYCRMNSKGVTVSFDTILRGMLTPTEYRLRKKQVAAQSLQDC